MYNLSISVHQLRFNYLFILLLTSNFLLAQRLDVDGKAKVRDMDVDNTSENIVVRQSDGTLAIRNLSSITNLPNSYINIESTDFSFLDNNDSLILEDFSIPAGMNRALIVHFQGTQNPGPDSVRYNGTNLIRYPANQRTFYLTLPDSVGTIVDDLEILLPESAIGFALIVCLTGVDPLCPLGVAQTSDMEEGSEVTNTLNAGFGNLMLGFTVAADLNESCTEPTLSSTTTEQTIHLNESGSFTGAISACATVGLASRPYLHRGNTEISWLATNGNPVIGDFNSVVINRADNFETKYSIGDSIEGGLIFYLDQTGKHGLICSTQDMNNTIWWNGVSRKVNANGELLFDGYMNTMLIVSQLTVDAPSASFAAKDALTPNVHPTLGGWHLPSIMELQLLHDNLHANSLGNFSTSSNYWSSSEIDNDNAKSLNFDGNSIDSQAKSTTNHVRPIRRF